MRISSQLITSSFLGDLSSIQQRLARLQHQSATGKAFDRPRDAPAAVSRSLNLQRALTYLNQYSRNADDGTNRLSFTETAVTEVQAQMQRLRELTVQGSNSYLTPADRGAIATEVNQLFEQVITLSNSSLRGRYVFSGFQTLTRSFFINASSDGVTSSVSYRGDSGQIGRNIGIQRDLDVNVSGRELFMEQTYTLTGKLLGSGALGFAGSFEMNDRFFSVSPGMKLSQLRDLINQDSEAGVEAVISGDNRLLLRSMSSSESIKLRDLSGTVLEDLGVLPQGAFNLAQSAPTLPLTDSRGAIHTSAALVFPLSIGTAGQTLVLQLGGAANSNVTDSKAIKLDAKSYNTSAELQAELQKKIDLAFGQEKILVNDMGGGVLELETFEQSGAVTLSDLRVGGTAADGTVDTASALLGFNALPGVQEVADLAGVDGNDRFSLDLGLSAYRTINGEPAVDLAPVMLNINAAAGLTAADVVADLNKQFLANKFLSGLVEAREEGGRIRLQTTRQGKEVFGTDLLLSNAVGGAVAPATDTLGALGFYRDVATGISAPPVPASVFSTAAYPPGIGAIALGVNDSFSIDLGPSSSLDGTDLAPQNIVLTAGAYPTAAGLAAEINSQIGLNPNLKNAVQAVVRTAAGLDYVDIETVGRGSRMQAADLSLLDVTPGALANLGLGAPTVPGGGGSDGQGDIALPDNIMDSMARIRDELYGFAAGESRLVALQTEGRASIGLYQGHKIRISSDGSFKELTVQRFTTLQDLASAIEDKLGFQLEVKVQRDGTIQIFNPSDTPVQGIKIEAFDQGGNPVNGFNQLFRDVSGNLPYRGTMISAQVYEDERFARLTQRIGNVDSGIEKILSTLSELGSRQKRLELTVTQNEVLEVNLQELQTSNDFVDMAEVITLMSQQENVLRAALSTGSRVLQPSLFDFLS
ncbi:flagellar hook-associated protein FlgL [bacterium]|nr:flagellar hook-associated protein FlgL [bacterium]